MMSHSRYIGGRAWDVNLGSVTLEPELLVTILSTASFSLSID